MKLNSDKFMKPSRKSLVCQVNHVEVTKAFKYIISVLTIVNKLLYFCL